MTLIPIILSGGSGTRLWPVSRAAHPKPFIKLNDGQSLLQKTFLRAAGLAAVKEILTVTHQDYLFNTQQEYQAVSVKAPTIPYNFLLEPSSRNTAPAIALAALQVMEQHGPDSILLVLAADHLIADQSAFQQSVQQAVTIAQQDKLVTFGIVPNLPHTGYGYIECGAPFDALGSCYVQQFTEKPSYEIAQSYVNSGKHWWNSGMFCFKASSLLHELKQHAENLLEQAYACWQNTQAKSKTRHIYHIDPITFANLPNISLDYAVMEKSSELIAIPSRFGWQDIGCWSAASELVEPDAVGNRVIGEAILINAKNNFIQSDSRLIAALGVDDLIIVDTPDALLVSHRSQTQTVKQVVEELKQKQHDTYKQPRTVTRPWGTYTVMEESENFKIKRIVVKSGAALSLQMHYHRSEHWIVVSGTAKVTNGDREFLVQVNESTFIPAGNRHRLENPGSVDLVIIEVQSGQYLGEDDIIRFEDRYDRV